MGVFVDCLGSLLIGVISLWGVWFASREFIRLVKSGTTFDRTLAPVRGKDNPKLLGLHMFGCVLLIITGSAIGIGFVVNAIRHCPVLQ